MLSGKPLGVPYNTAEWHPMKDALPREILEFHKFPSIKTAGDSRKRPGGPSRNLLKSFHKISS